jgi:hypothetical protein
MSWRGDKIIFDTREDAQHFYDSVPWEEVFIIETNVKHWQICEEPNSVPNASFNATGKILRMNGDDVEMVDYANT